MLAIPIINPMRIPIPISDPPRDLYNFIEDNINPGDNILMWAGFELNTWETEYQPASLAVISHLLLKGADVYIICDGTETPPLAATLFDDPNMKRWRKNNVSRRTNISNASSNNNVRCFTSNTMASKRKRL
jgi:hypothetical protein